MLARILIVEDNTQNLELMRYLLAAHGYEVLAAVDGVAAMSILVRNQPDLILCDIQMPRMNGFELLKWLRAQEQLHAIPVIAVTALAMVGDRAEMLAAGFDGYLSKPITPETFVSQACAHLPAYQRAEPLRAKVPARKEKEEGVRGVVQRPHALVVDNLQSNPEFAEVVLDHLGFEKG
jgi:CheY-like chemotaxis protein